MNPLLDFSGLPRFADIQPAHVTPAVDQLLAENRALIDRLASAPEVPTWDSFVAPLDDPVRSYFIGSSLVWLFVCLLPVMDPQWKERLANLKDAVSSMKDAKDLFKSGDAKPPT